MSRNLSAAAKRAVFAQETDEVFIETVVIDHPDLAEPLRFVGNTQHLEIGGALYLAAGFRIELPREGDGGTGAAKLSVCNIDRRVTDIVRSLSTPPTISASIIRARDPETPEAGPFEFTIRNVSYDAQTISGDLLDDVDGRANCPAIRYTPQAFPGLY